MRERVELEVVRWIENQLEHWTGERNNSYLAEYVASIDTLGEVKEFIAESFGDETGSVIFTQVRLFSDLFQHLYLNLTTSVALLVNSLTQTTH